MDRYLSGKEGTMNIIDYKGNRIKTVSSLNKSSQLVIFYPGYNYNLKAPIFFYLEELFEEKNFDILGIDYRYNDNPDFLNASSEEKETWFEYDCSAIGKEVLRLVAAYDRIVYIGKSLGTTVLWNQLKNNLIPEQAEIIYLTPGTYAHEICLTIKNTKNRTFVAYGNADKHYNKTAIDLIRDRKAAYIKEIEKAGHVFEVEGDIKQSIQNLVEVIASIESFLESN